MKAQNVTSTCFMVSYLGTYETVIILDDPRPFIDRETLTEIVVCPDVFTAKNIIRKQTPNARVQVFKARDYFETDGAAFLVGGD